MSTQTSPIVLGHRIGWSGDDSNASDLQQVVTKVLAILSRRRWLFVMPLLAGMLAALTLSLFLPRRYYLRALLERRDDAVITQLVNSKSEYSFDALRQSLVVDLKGYNAMCAAVEQLGLTRRFPRDADGKLTPEGKAARQALVSGLVGQVSVSVKENSPALDLIEVGYLGADPDLGVRIVNQLKDNYMERARLKISDILKGSYEFFSQEAGERKKKVAEMKSKLLEVLKEHPGIDPSDPGLLDQCLLRENLALDELQRRRSEVEARIAVCQESLRELSGQREAADGADTRPASLLSEMVPNPRHQQLKREIKKLNEQIADERVFRHKRDQHPDVVSLREKLNWLRAQLAEEPEQMVPVSFQKGTGGSEPGLSPWEAQRWGAEKELKSLQKDLAQIERETARHRVEKEHLEEEKSQVYDRRLVLLVRQDELGDATRDLAVWDGHVDRIARVLTAEAKDRGIKFSSVEQARRPDRPVSPTLSGVFLLSAGVGIALGVIAVFLREVFDRSLRDPSRVRQSLGIPVLEIIGEIRGGRACGWLGRRLFPPAFASVQAILLLGISALVYLSLEKPALYDRIVTQSASLWPG